MYQKFIDALLAPEQLDIPACMQKENAFASPELVFIDDEIYQAFHGPGGVIRIRQYTLVSGYRREGGEHTSRGGAVDGIDVIGVYRDITRRRRLFEPEMH